MEWVENVRLYVPPSLLKIGVEGRLYPGNAVNLSSPDSTSIFVLLFRLVPPMLGLVKLVLKDALLVGL